MKKQIKKLKKIILSYKPIKVSFMVVGAQKGGTSALYSFLKKHPQVSMSNIKETNFFFTETYWSKGINYKTYHRFYNPSMKRKIYGEASPGYMLNYKEVAPRIKRYNPNTKLLFILKNPIERAYSQYKMHVKRYGLDITFSEALDIAFCDEEKDLIIFDEESGLSSETIKSYLLFGHYVEQIKGFKNLFEEKQMLFVLTEELYFNHQETMNVICDFLDIHNFNSEHKIIHSNQGDEMDSASKQRLKKYFKPHLDELGLLIGKDVSHWKDV